MQCVIIPLRQRGSDEQIRQKRSIAGVPGLEPRLNEPESLGLPITPYPTKIDALTSISEWLRIAELWRAFERVA